MKQIKVRQYNGRGLFSNHLPSSDLTSICTNHYKFSDFCVCIFIYLAIDGDGMLCAVTFQNGQVHFQSKFVNSKHRQEEKAKQKLLYHGQMGTKPTSSMLRSIMAALKRSSINYRNPSNTNSFYWGGKVSQTDCVLTL